MKRITTPRAARASSKEQGSTSALVSTKGQKDPLAADDTDASSQVGSSSTGGQPTISRRGKPIQETVLEPTIDSNGSTVYLTAGINSAAPAHDYHFI